MAKATVADLAVELKVTPETLLVQLKAAGVSKSTAEDSISEKDKTQLLDHLREQHGRSEPKTRITLTRKQTSEIKKADSATGKARTIQVEVRKKRVLVKRDNTEALASEVDEVQELVTAPIPEPEVQIQVQPEPVVEVVAEVAVPEPEVIAEVVEPEPEPEPSAPVVAAPGVSASPIDDAQRALRSQEASRQAELRARQTADAMDKLARARAKKEAEEKALADAQAAVVRSQAEKAAPKADEKTGTLHRPAAKAAEKAAPKKSGKKAEKPT
ncbi:MAG: translation initiation factor IF-2 associated domain-containing protein, partial [Burkholderiales bacterium]